MVEVFLNFSFLPNRVCRTIGLELTAQGSEIQCIICRTNIKSLHDLIDGQSRIIMENSYFNNYIFLLYSFIFIQI